MDLLSAKRKLLPMSGPQDSGGGGGGGTQTQVTDLPEWAKPYAEKSLAKTEALTTDKPYQSYGQWAQQRGFDPSQVAGFTGLQQQAFQGAGQLQPSAATDVGMGLAGSAAARALGTRYNPYQTGQFGSQAGMYMSPFIQEALEPQMREARRASEMQRQADQARAVSQGAFGGSRQAIVEAERQRNLGTQLGDIQAKGLQSAFDQARQQFNTEQQLREQSRQYGAGLGLQGLQTALQGAGQLGQLGTQQFGQQKETIGLQSQMGAQQQQLDQARINALMQDYAAQQKYPYQQLEFMSNILRGTPMGMTQTLYGAQPSVGSQLLGAGTSLAGAYMMGGGRFAEGGLASAYAEGGSVTDERNVESILNKLSDAQLQQARQMAVARKDAAQLQLIDRELAERAAMRSAKPPMAAGIDTLPADNMDFAGGGIVAFADGGDVERYAPGGSIFAQLDQEKADRLAQLNSQLATIEPQLRAAAASGDQQAIQMYAQQAQSIRNQINAVREAAGNRIGGIEQLAMPAAPAVSAAPTGPMSEAAAPVVRAGSPTDPNFRRVTDPRMTGTPAVAPEVKQAKKEEDKGLGGTPEAAAARRTAAPAASAGPTYASLDPNKLFETAMTRLGKEERPERKMIEDLNTAREDAAKAEKAGIEALNAKFSDAYKGRRERLEGKEAELGGMKDQYMGLALLQAGAAMMSTPGSLGVSLGKGIEAGSKQYVAGMDKLNAAKDKLADARDRLDELQLNRDEMSARDILKAESKIRDVALAGREKMIQYVMDTQNKDRETAMKIVDQQMKLGLAQISENRADARSAASRPFNALEQQFNMLKTGNPQQDAELLARLQREQAEAKKPGLDAAALEKFNKSNQRLINSIQNLSRVTKLSPEMQAKLDQDRESLRSAAIAANIDPQAIPVLSGVSSGSGVNSKLLSDADKIAGVN